MSNQWYLKKYDDGSVFGPVDVATLKDWSAKGEISPYDMLSPDGVKWMAAPELPELDMNWIVEFPDGEAYGPTCIEAIVSFLEDGQLTPDNHVRNAATGEKSTIREHPAFQSFEFVESDSTEDGSPDGEGSEETATTPEQELEYLRQRVAELEETNEKMQAAHEIAMEQLNSELVTAKTQQQFLRSELDLLKETLSTQKASKDVSQSQLEVELTRIREQFDLLSELNKQLTHNYEESVAQLNRKIEQTLATIEATAEREAELNRQVAEASEREAHYREQIIEMEKEVAKAQQAQAGLLGKYSEVNEKFMQFLKTHQTSAEPGESPQPPKHGKK